MAAVRGPALLLCRGVSTDRPDVVVEAGEEGTEVVDKEDRRDCCSCKSRSRRAWYSGFGLFKTDPPSKDPPPPLCEDDDDRTLASERRSDCPRSLVRDVGMRRGIMVSDTCPEEEEEDEMLPPLPPPLDVVGRG